MYYFNAYRPKLFPYELLGIKTTYVRDTAQNDSVVSLSKPLNAQQAKQYMQTLAEKNVQVCKL